MGDVRIAIFCIREVSLKERAHFDVWHMRALLQWTDH